MNKRRAAVLWTGGKDCALALCRASDDGIDIACLATFYPEGNAHDPFKAHPLNAMRRIAASLGFPHELLAVGEQYEADYIRGLRYLRNRHGVDTVVTGDIDLVDGKPNWIRHCCAEAELEAVMPLWQAPRETLLTELVSRGIAASVSWINSDHIPREWIGRTIDERFIADIRELALRVPIDMSGENGEYHTMVSSVQPASLPRA
ncbi:MAG TPA: hypothetical protein VFH72_03140 [Candidatus Baltobacteraceae bacterium]|nr:hypothetical protein [Candidatus Baltobacteraceae bacterium]